MLAALRLDVIRSFEIPEDKISGYLLNAAHRGGGAGKAKFFLGCGFYATEPQTLANALFQHLVSEASSLAFAPHPFGYGTNLKVVGRLKSPDGQDPIIQALWLLNHENDRASFVTTYPARRSGV